jgi:predicted ester cyclase
MRVIGADARVARDPLARGVVLHHRGVLEPMVGRDAATRSSVTHRAGSPDLPSQLDACVVEGDRVAAPLTWRGTHHGAYAGVPPTCAPVAVSGSVMCDVAGERIAEVRAQLDTLSLRRRIGALTWTGAA